MQELAELARAMRGDVVDNVHRGSVVVVDAAGEIRFAVGDPGFRAFIRSAGKPLQALALIEEGGAEAFGLDDSEIAIICASHPGGPLQIQTVRGVLAKVGVDETALRAGKGIEDNCSGKHAGMLALARLGGHPLEGYLDVDHPIQKTILERISAMCGLPVEEIDVALDGCGAPIFAMPLRNMALAYARLANPEKMGAKTAAATERIVRAMQDHPEMLGGLDLKRICDRKLVLKSGASGCYCAGFSGKDLGIALKIADGSPPPTLPVLFEVARRQGLIDEDEFGRFQQAVPPLVKNRKGQVVGTLEIAF